MEYLEKDPLLHMDMTESIRRGKAEVLESSDRGVLLYHTDANVPMISAESEDAAAAMISRIPEAQEFVVHQEHCAAAVRKKFGLTGQNRCYQSAWLKKESIPEPCRSFEIRPLDESFLSFVCDHYTLGLGPEYVSGRLAAGEMFGAFVGGECAGFIGLHPEGSMGMLEVLPRFRRRGIAVGLEVYLANRMLAQGFTPFGQILIHNDASLRLHEKLHFEISQNILSWMF